jgi:hypothetical protein
MNGGMTEVRRVVIGEHEFELRPWSLIDGRKWLYRLTTVALAAGKVGTDSKALSKMLDGLDEATFLALCETVDSYTSIVTRGERGEQVQPLKAAREVFLRGKHTLQAKLLKEHLVMEFSDFFAELPSLLGRSAEQKGQ